MKNQISLFTLYPGIVGPVVENNSQICVDLSGQHIIWFGGLKLPMKLTLIYADLLITMYSDYIFYVF